MSTDLQTTGGESAAAKPYLKLCDPGSRQARAFQENVGDGGFNIDELPKVKVPTGGGTTWLFETVRGEEVHKEIEGVIVGICNRGSLYPTQGEGAAEGTWPVLSTIAPWGQPLTVAVRPKEGEKDEDFGDIDPEVLEECRLGEIDGVSVYDWPKLPYTQWGSGRGDGKRAKEFAEVFLLRSGDTVPLCISIPPGSLKEFGKAIRSLPVPYSDAVIGLSLEEAKKKDDGTKYARIVPRLVEELTETEGQFVAENISPAFKASVKQQCLPGAKVAALIEDQSK